MLRVSVTTRSWYDLQCRQCGRADCRAEVDGWVAIWNSRHVTYSTRRLLVYDVTSGMTGDVIVWSVRREGVARSGSRITVVYACDLVDDLATWLGIHGDVSRCVLSPIVNQHGHDLDNAHSCLAFLLKGRFDIYGEIVDRSRQWWFHFGVWGTGPQLVPVPQFRGDISEVKSISK